MWVTTFLYDVEPGEEYIADLSEQLEDIDGTAAGLPGVGHTITLFTDEPDPFQAATVARDTLGVYRVGQLVAVETVSTAQYERLAQGLPAWTTAG